MADSDSQHKETRRDLRNLAYGAFLAVVTQGLYDILRDVLPSTWPPVDVVFLSMLATGVWVIVAYSIVRVATKPRAEKKKVSALTLEQIENQKVRDRNNELFFEAAYQYLANHLVTLQGEGTGVVATSARLNLEDPNVANVALAYSSLMNQQETSKQQERIQKRSDQLASENNRLQIFLAVLIGIQAIPVVVEVIKYLSSL